MWRMNHDILLEVPANALTESFLLPLLFTVLLAAGPADGQPQLCALHDMVRDGWPAAGSRAFASCSQQQPLATTYNSGSTLKPVASSFTVPWGLFGRAVHSCIPSLNRLLLTLLSTAAVSHALCLLLLLLACAASRRARTAPLRCGCGCLGWTCGPATSPPGTRWRCSSCCWGQSTCTGEPGSMHAWRPLPAQGCCLLSCKQQQQLCLSLHVRAV